MSRLRAAWAAGVAVSAGIALISGTVFVIATAVGSDQASPAKPAAPQPGNRLLTPEVTRPAERWVRTTARPTGVRRGADPRLLVVTFDAPAGPACSRLPRARVPSESGSTVQVAVTYETVVPLCTATGRSAVRVLTRAPLRDREIIVNGARYGPSIEGTYLRCGPDGCAPPSEHCADERLDDATRAADIPPDRPRRVQACTGVWLIADVDAVRWYFRYADDRWRPLLSTRSPGCAAVRARVPAIPEALCHPLAAPA